MDKAEEFRNNNNNKEIIRLVKKSKTLIYALGGLEEVGKNTYCIEHNNEIIIIDAGVKFPDASLLGIDSIVPDLSYLKENRQKIKAILITHGHEDHIGGIPNLLKQIPEIPFIYAPELASSLINFKLDEKGIKQKPAIIKINSDSKIKTKYFNISLFAVNHSIPDAFGFYINTPNGNIAITGDYKFDWTPLGHNADIKKMAEMGGKGVDLLMSDSTNSEKDGYTQTEIDIINNIDKIFYKTKDRIIITLFASNVHRIQNIIKLAKKHDRKIIICGRSIENIIKIIRRLGHLKVSDNSFIKSYNSINENKEKNNDNTLVICTGSQGEKNAALSKMAVGEHNTITINKKDTIIFSASPIPGNRKSVEIIINNLIKLGAKVYENSKYFALHTSGHASKEEQKLMVTLLKPKYFMPIHGDYRMLKIHGETANKVSVKKENIFICANGDQISLLNNKAWVSNRIEAGPIYIDGKDTSGKSSAIIKDRNTLSKNGLIAIIFTINSKTNKLILNPKIICRGSFYVKTSRKLINQIIKISYSVISQTLEREKPTFSQLKNGLRSAIAPYIFKYKRKNPLIIPIILNKK